MHMPRVIDGGIYPYLVPFARTVAGAMMGLMLGIFGGWLAKILNAMLGYPWDPALHYNIEVVGIGLGGGLGAYLAWMNLEVRWFFVIGAILLVLGSGVAGAYLGQEYGKVVEPNYLGRFATIDNNIHFGAAVGGIVVASALGLFNYMKNLGR